eukprot:1148873-Pelagomonas_calceolata.AAC.3
MDFANPSCQKRPVLPYQSQEPDDVLLNPISSLAFSWISIRWSAKPYQLAVKGLAGSEQTPVPETEITQA